MGDWSRKKDEQVQTKPVWSEGGRECKRSQSQIIQAFENLASVSDREPLEDSLRFNPWQVELSIYPLSTPLLRASYMPVSGLEKWREWIRQTQPLPPEAYDPKAEMQEKVNTHRDA